MEKRKGLENGKPWLRAKDESIRDRQVDDRAARSSKR